MCAGLGALIPILIVLLSRLAVATVCCVLVYGLLIVWARRQCGRWLGLLPMVSVLWIIYYPVRLLRIELDRNDPLLHPAVRRATDGDLTWVWVISTAGLAMLLFGAWVVGQVRLVRAAKIDHLRRPAFTTLSIVGLAVALGTLTFHVSSGILSNVGPIALIGLAGLGFLDAQRGRTSYRTVSLVAIALLVGALAGFKELATLPAIAWGIGLVAGRRSSIRPRTVLAVAAIALFAYIGVAGQRIARPLGEPTDLPHAAFNSLTRYDLESGVVHKNGNHGWGIIGNVASGLSRRSSGVEALVILRETVPNRVNYQGGRTLVLPLLTVFPGSKDFTGDTPFSTLSLGRYYSQNFYSLNPGTDPSSQAITLSGDLYLNFGIVGVIVGLFLIGTLVGAFDRRYPPTSAFSAGLLAYAGTQAIGLERNVAYVLVTVFIRLAIASVAYWVLVGAWRNRGRVSVAGRQITVAQLMTTSSGHSA